MTTYVPIPNGDIDQDSPVTQPLLTALRDNPIAMAEGASGAPKIATLALEPPTGAATYVIRRIQQSQAVSSSSAYQAVLNHDRFSAAWHLGFTVLVPGTIYCYLEHGVLSPTGLKNSNVRILKNGTQLAAWSYNGLSGVVARSLTVNVDIGDIIIYQQYGNDAYWQNLLVYSGNKNMAVA